MSTYSELLKHPKWQKRRLQILSEHKFSCQNCGTDDETLHIHHGYYEKGKKPWEYEDDTLHALCGTCHERFEELSLHLKRSYAKIGSEAALITLIHCAFAIELSQGPFLPSHRVKAIEGELSELLKSVRSSLKWYRKTGWECLE